MNSEEIVWAIQLLFKKCLVSFLWWYRYLRILI